MIRWIAVSRPGHVWPVRSDDLLNVTVAEGRWRRTVLNSASCEFGECFAGGYDVGHAKGGFSCI
jgi:hypothetical protein